MTDMALLYRSELEPNPGNIFRRRACWESALISYGRLVVSNWEREIPFVEFLEEVTGDDGVALHERLMDWRQGHVAHRTSAEFESNETVLAYASGSDTPNTLKVVVGIDMGPLDDSEFAISFKQHVKTLRDAIFERRLQPLGYSIVEDVNGGRIARSELRPAEEQSSSGRYVVAYNVLALAPPGSLPQ